MPTWGGTYENPFYHNVRGNVKGELNARAAHYGTRIRAGKTNSALEWSYGKTAYGHVKGKSGVTLGFPGAKVMSDMSGNIKLYNSRNVPKFPLLQSIDVTNDGTVGSLLRGKFVFTYFPEMGSGGFNMSGLDKAFFTPGVEVNLSWGWSYGGPSCRQAFTGIVNNFNWSFNPDLSMTADCSVVSAATLALGLSGDQSVKLENTGTTTEIKDPAEVPIQASNLASVIDVDLGLGNKDEEKTDSEQTPTPPPDASAGGGGVVTWEAVKAGDITAIPAASTINKLLDYIGIGWPFQEEAAEEEEVDSDKKEDVPPEGEAPVKTFWYITIDSLVDFGNKLIKAFEKGGTGLSQIFTLQVEGNYTCLVDIQSAYPMDVIFPSTKMGAYGDCVPAYPFQWDSSGKGEIGKILLGVDHVKKSYKEFVAENTANIPYKNITNFFETILKQVNIASGDMYQLSAVLCEPPSNFDGASDGKLAKSVVSIEDSNLCKTYTDSVKPFRFDATIFKPLIKTVSISSKPPAAMAAAAYVQQRGNAPANTENKADAPKGAEAELAKAKDSRTKAVENFTKTGFNLAWCEGFRGILTTIKKTSSNPADAHWLNQALYPIDFSVTIDGVSGFRFGDVVSTSLVPSSYLKAKLVFVVTKIDHKITAAAWETTLTTAARIAMDGSTL